MKYIFGDSGMFNGHQMVSVLDANFMLIESDLTKNQAIAKYGEPSTWVMI